MQSWRDREFQSVREIAQIMGIGRNSAYELAHKLPHVMIGRQLRIRTVHLEKYIKDQERTGAKPKLRLLRGGKYERTEDYR